MPLRGPTYGAGGSERRVDWSGACLVRLFDPLRAFVCGSSVVSLTSFDFV